MRREPAPTEADRAILAEQVRVLYVEGQRLILTGVAAALILVWVLWDHVPHTILLGWLAVFCLYSLVRAAMRFSFGLAKKSVAEMPLFAFRHCEEARCRNAPTRNSLLAASRSPRAVRSFAKNGQPTRCGADDDPAFDRSSHLRAVT